MGRTSGLGWSAVVAGGLAGSLSTLAVLKQLIEEPSPNLGWGVVALLSWQPIALSVVAFGVLAIFAESDTDRRPLEISIALAVLWWVAIAFVGLGFHNSGC